MLAVGVLFGTAALVALVASALAPWVKQPKELQQPDPPAEIWESDGRWSHIGSN